MHILWNAVWSVGKEDFERGYIVVARLNGRHRRALSLVEIKDSHSMNCDLHDSSWRKGFVSSRLRIRESLGRDQCLMETRRMSPKEALGYLRTDFSYFPHPHTFALENYQPRSHFYRQDLAKQFQGEKLLCQGIRGVDLNPPFRLAHRRSKWTRYR